MQALAEYEKSVGIMPRYQDEDELHAIVHGITNPYPPVAYCPPSEFDKSFMQGAHPEKFKRAPHRMNNPVQQRKTAGTKRVGPKGRKMPTRGTCTGCSANVILVDNYIDPNWPLYIEKHVIREWP